MKHFFLNPNTGIIRAGWRIIIYIFILLAIDLFLTFTVREILGSLKGGGLLWFVLLGLSATLAAFISRKYVDKESLTSLGLHFNKLAFLDVIIGVVIGALIMTGMYFTLLYSGLIKFEGFSWWMGSVGADLNFRTTGIYVMLGMILQFTIVAWWEEITFRGIFLQNISKGLGRTWGVILSTIIFGLIHLGNPDATVLSTALIMVVTLQLVYAYLKSGQLWLPIGLHLGWNFFQASIFGFSSSGRSSPTMLTQSPIGPDWLSGGDFGAENSILIIPFTLGSVFLIQWWIGKTRATKGNTFFSFLINKQTMKI